jgi:hypothetical protein
MEDKNFDLGEDPELVDRLVPDPANPDVRRLRGFLIGKSNREGYLRLYVNTDLTHYLEFPESDTVHAKQVRGNQTIVWVRPQTRIQIVKTDSISVELLRGNIIRDQLTRTVGSGFRMMARAAGADGSGCAHAGCSAGCTPGYGCGGTDDTYGYTCAC